MSPSTWRERSDAICTRSRSSSLSVLTMSALKPAPLSTSSIPRTIGGNSGLVMSGSTSPTVPDFDVFRQRAMGLGWKPRASAARCTRRAVSALTRRRVAGFRAREAVAVWTPAASATSRSVGARTTAILGSFTRPDPTQAAAPAPTCWSARA